MRIVSLAALSLVAVLGVAPLAHADGWKGPISQFLGSGPQNPGSAAVLKNSNASQNANQNATQNTHSQNSQNNYNQNSNNNQNSSTRSVPVPGTFALFGGSFGLFAAWHRRMGR